MATLKLMRPEEKNNRLADMEVFLDGQLLGTIRNNETRKFDIPVGRHRLRVKIDTQGSKPRKFSIADGETRAFVLATDNEANVLGPTGSGAVLIDLIVSAFMLLYYFTTGHNRYLTISELKYR